MGTEFIHNEFIWLWQEKGVEASVDGVLGGFGQVNDADIKGSEAFLNTLLQERFGGRGRNQHLVALGTSLSLSLSQYPLICYLSSFIFSFFHVRVIMCHSNFMKTIGRDGACWMY